MDLKAARLIAFTNNHFRLQLSGLAGRLFNGPALPWDHSADPAVILD